jgi:hypothetical protein
VAERKLSLVLSFGFVQPDESRLGPRRDIDDVCRETGIFCCDVAVLSMRCWVFASAKPTSDDIEVTLAVNISLWRALYIRYCGLICYVDRGSVSVVIPA